MSNIRFFRFLNTLPEQTRDVYCLLQAYKDFLSITPIVDEFTEELYSSVISCFESKINEYVTDSKLNTKQHTESLYSNKDSIELEDKYKVVRELDKQFDDKLGAWASSFSDSSTE